MNAELTELVFILDRSGSNEVTDILDEMGDR